MASVAVQATKVRAGVRNAAGDRRRWTGSRAEGTGVVSEVGGQIDPSLGLRPGVRVAFFPAPGSRRDEVVVPAGSVERLPDSIPDEVGAQVLINTASALTAIRAAHNSLPPDARTGVVVLVTAAGSAVGRLLCKLLTNRGVKVIGLVRSEAGAAKLTGILPGFPFFATDVAGWKDRVRAAAEGAKIHTAIDSVGGRLLGDIGELLAEGTGTVINYGSLGGETSDIRIFPPRCLTLKGVVLGQWLQLPPEQRKADFALALQLAHEHGPLFEVAERYPPSRIADAVAHIGQPGRAGSVRTQGGAISSTRTPASFSRKTLRKGVGVERRLGRGIDRRERERHEAQDRTRISNDRIVPLLQMPDERGTHADRPHQVGGDRVD